MKTLLLNIPERLVALSVFNNPENRVATENLKIYLDDVHKFRITDEEKVAINWVQDEEKTSVTWNEEGVPPRSIELEDFTAKLLTERLGKLEYSATDSLAGSVVSLFEKLK